ncbi:MAG: ribbon-helix-helix protein, CopG family [Hyphomonadaceae bacterium]|nr:ribbon-helix-helix protein, CopG family [Hyphomonadaceae bacterium]
MTKASAPGKTATLTVRLSEKTKARLEKIAKLSRRSKSWHVAEALEIYLRNELPIVESIVKAQADGRAGKGISLDDMKAETRAIIAEAMARQKSRRT